MARERVFPGFRPATVENHTNQQLQQAQAMLAGAKLRLDIHTDLIEAMAFINAGIKKYGETEVPEGSALHITCQGISALTRAYGRHCHAMVEACKADIQAIEVAIKTLESGLVLPTMGGPVR